MSNIVITFSNIRFLDNMSKKNTLIHRIHPLIKLLITTFYIMAVVSFEKQEIASLLPFIFYPIVILTFAEIPVLLVIKRLLLALPFILGIAILNPLFDRHLIVLSGIPVSRGWVTLLSILIKSILIITSSLLLIATTGIEELSIALRLLKVPKIVVLQFLLTYRYISILMEEVTRMLRAYFLRSPRQKGIKPNAWGSFAGQLILRTLDRSQRIYESMGLRGFNGEYHVGNVKKIKMADLIYLLCWILFFVIARTYNIPMLIGSCFYLGG